MQVAIELYAKKYAIAYMNLYGKELTIRGLEMLQEFADFIKQYPGVVESLALPSIAQEAKSKVIAMLAERYYFGAGFCRLLQLLIDHKRLDYLQLVIVNIIRIYRKLNGILSIKVSMSHQLTTGEKELINNFIRERTNYKTVQADYIMAPELLSGLRIQSDDFLWERSIRKLLRHVEQTMLQRVGS